MKSLRFFLLAMGSFLIFGSCNSNQSSGILSDSGSCDILDCPTPQTTVEGSLGIEADAGTYYQNVDQGDVIEIAGKCSDLGVRNNRIMVEVYEGEDHPDAYIDNSRSLNCENSLTPALNGQRCFWITQGRGVVDGGLEYPQCFNGRFSFSVRLGRIIRTIESAVNPAAINDDASNPRKKYMVRFKLRIQDGAISETPWNSTLIDRGVTKVTFSQETTSASHICNIKLNAYRNLFSLLDITYSGTLTREYINNPSNPIHPLHGLSLPVALFNPSKPLLYPINDGFSVVNFNMANIETPGVSGAVIPGVRHKLQFIAEDQRYDYSAVRFGGAIETSPISEELQCGYARPTIISGTVFDGNGATRNCSISLNFPSVNSGWVQWVAIKGGGGTWAENFDPTAGVHYISALQPASGPHNFIFYPNNYPGLPCAPAANCVGEYYVGARYIPNPANSWIPGDPAGAWTFEAARCPFANSN